MPEAAFVLSPAQPMALRELAETVAHELALQDVPAHVHETFPEPTPERVYIWVDPAGYLAAEGDSAAPGAAILRRTVMLYDEHRVPGSAGAAQMALARAAGAVFCLDARSLRELQRRLIPARLMRPGYSTALDRFSADGARPTDVVSFDEVEGAVDKWALLGQAKVVLNLHASDDADIEWRRVVDAVHAGTVVVSEHSASLSPLIAGEHLLVASADAVPSVADALLRDPQRLARMRTAAYDRLRSWLPFALPVSVLRAALVELVGEPVDPDAPRGTPGQSAAVG